MYTLEMFLAADKNPLISSISILYVILKYLKIKSMTCGQRDRIYTQTPIGIDFILMFMTD